LLSGNRAVLSDFDGVRDINTTVTRHSGGTVAYWAQEIKNGGTNHFTTATDIYAVGLICREMLEGTSVPRDRWELGVNRMLSDVASERPSARQCLALPFVSDANVADVGQCGICFELVELAKGISCESEHFVCPRQATPT
jgi:hypothetical protein